MRRPRIRREDAPRPFFRDLDGKIPAHAGTIADYGFSIARQGWRHVGWTDSGAKRRRSLFHLHRGEEWVTAIRCAEYRLFPLEGFDLFAPLDADSDMEARLAVALQENWDDPGTELAAFGSIAVIEDIWSARSASRESPWVPALATLFDTLLADCACALTLPFPLEYEGRAPEEMPSHLGFTRRQRAMIRIAERLFDTVQLEGEAGEDGWLWMPLRGEGLIPRPTITRAPPEPHLRLVR